MYDDQECELNVPDVLKKTCEKNIEDPEDANIIFGFKQKETENKLTKKHKVQAESIQKHYYLLEIFVEKIKLIPEPVKTDDEFEFLEEAVKKRILDEQERKKKMQEKVVTKIKFLDFPTMEIEQNEYKEPEVVKKKKIYKEWERGEDEDEDEEKNWLNELKEKMKQIEKEEKENEEAKKRPPDPAVLKMEQLKKKALGEELIGKCSYFSMIPAVLKNAMESRPLDVLVHLPGSDIQKKKPKYIGETKVTICETILDAIVRACCPLIQVPVIRTTKRDYDIYSNLEKRNTALMSLMIRLVCMGPDPWPRKRVIPRPVMTNPTEMETLLENLKELGPEGLARTCPLLKEHRVSKKEKLLIDLLRKVGRNKKIS